MDFRVKTLEELRAEKRVLADRASKTEVFAAKGGSGRDVEVQESDLGMVKVQRSEGKKLRLRGPELVMGSEDKKSKSRGTVKVRPRELDGVVGESKEKKLRRLGSLGKSGEEVKGETLKKSAVKTLGAVTKQVRVRGAEEMLKGSEVKPPGPEKKRLIMLEEKLEAKKPRLSRPESLRGPVKMMKVKRPVAETRGPQGLLKGRKPEELWSKDADEMSGQKVEDAVKMRVRKLKFGVPGEVVVGSNDESPGAEQKQLEEKKYANSIPHSTGLAGGNEVRTCVREGGGDVGEDRVNPSQDRVNKEGLDPEVEQKLSITELRKEM
jgi:hypothetical protein